VTIAFPWLRAGIAVPIMFVLDYTSAGAVVRTQRICAVIHPRQEP
jgi:hypothetical protein